MLAGLLCACEPDPKAPSRAEDTAPAEDAPPTVSLVAPEEGALLAGDATLTAEAADDGGISRVTFHAGDEQVGEVTEAPYTVIWASATVPDGTIAIRAVAYDTSGQAMEVAATVTVDNTSPTVVVVAPSEGATVAGVVVIEAEVTDSVGLDTVACLLDGVELEPVGDVAWAWDTTGEVFGPHTVEVVATDVAGNEGVATIVVTSVSVDADGDGVAAPEWEGEDCDDDAPDVHPGAAETVADGVDQDCDGVDTCYTDADGDGYGTSVVSAGSSLDCVTGDGAAVATDCDDGDVAINPDASETDGDGLDSDCDGLDDLPVPPAIVVYTGYGDQDQAGCAVAGVGDVDADGYDDILLSAPNNDGSASNSGSAFLVLGSASPASASVSAADAVYAGEARSDGLADGHGTLSGAGDVNADGFDDMLLGCSTQDSAGSDSGAAYLLFGSATPVTATLGSTGVEYDGQAVQDYAGSAVAGVGDVDADGYDDVLIGAPGNDTSGYWAGAAHLVLGSASPASGGLATASAVFTGEAPYDQAGNAVAAGGDVDGDGVPDLFVGAVGNDAGGTAAGAAYLLLGGAPASLGLTSADARYTGAVAGDYAGKSVAGGIDVDADGYKDLLVGAPYNDDGGRSAGAVYLVLGGATPTSGSLASADAIYWGSQNYDYAGQAVAGIGDHDADGYDDIVMQTYTGQGNSGSGWDGAAFLVRGGPSPSSIFLEDADDAWYGDILEHFGSSVAGAGDVDGNGTDDLLIGAYGNSDVQSGAGAVYLVRE